MIRTLQMNVHQIVPRLLLGLLQQTVVRRPGAVDDNIRSEAGSVQLGLERAHLFPAAAVRTNGDRTYAECAAICRYPLRLDCRSPVLDDHAEAFGREPPGDSRAYAARPARYESRPAQASGLLTTDTE